MVDDDALRGWADFELECLWNDLRAAHQRTGYATWSTGCEHLGERVKTLTAILGPISWRRVPIAAIANGWFARINEMLGIENPDLPDEDGIAYAQMWVRRQAESLQ